MAAPQASRTLVTDIWHHTRREAKWTMLLWNFLLTKCTLSFSWKHIFSNGLLPVYLTVSHLGISTIFQLGTKIENNTFSCTLFPLPQLDAWRCMQHTVRFAYVLLGCAHFITQKTHSRNITKCLKNRTDKTNTLIWRIQWSIRMNRDDFDHTSPPLSSCSQNIAA